MVACVFFGERPRPRLFNPPTMGLAGNFRPANKPFGGLWTCPEEQGVAWYHWSRGTRWSRRLWLLTAAEAKVYVIDSEEDFQAALHRWPTRHPLTRTPEIDFVQASAEYDAVSLTPAGLARTRFIWPSSLYGWDVPTILWLRWVFDSVKSVQSVVAKRARSSDEVLIAE
jgi:hypothetical protein